MTTDFLARTSRGLIAAALLLGALLWQPRFASAASLTVAPGQSITVSANLKLGQTVSGANVILSVADSSGKFTSLRAMTTANFIIGQSTPVSAKVTVPASFAAGTYTVSAEIYSHNWSAELRWIPGVSSFLVATPPALPSTGAAELAWVAPTENTDGTVLTNLAGYKIYYGTSASSMTQTVTIANPGLTAYTLSDLPAGNWYFEVTAYSSAGIESDVSGVVGTTL